MSDPDPRQSMKAPARMAVAIAVAGAALTGGASMVLKMTPSEAFRLAGIAAGAALVAGILGAALLAALRRRSIAAQVGVVVLVCMVAAAVGVGAAAEAMFLSAHDVNSLIVILLAAGTVGALVAFLLGQRVISASRSLGAAVRRIGEDGPIGTRPGADGLGEHRGEPSTSELAGLAQELDRMTARLDEAAEREHALDRSRRELVAWVSHDLRTPLAGIRAIAEALEDGVIAEPTDASRAYRTLRRETDRLSELVDDLFELSVIQAGALRLQMQRASLGDLVSDALAAASAGASAKGVTLEGRLDSTPPELELSPPEVARVLRNLLENAIRHTPSDGTVWVEAGVERDEAFVSVADECGGIPPDHLDRIFEPAFRGEAARTPRADGGAGLGLAIARGIVEAHRGRISVQNAGKGCRFVVRLPVGARR